MIDPELGYNIVDLGMVYDIGIERSIVDVTMTMTTQGCPAQDYIVERRGASSGRGSWRHRRVRHRGVEPRLVAASDVAGGEGAFPHPRGCGMTAPDTVADQVGDLNRLLVLALLALARAGAGDEACRIAARGWSLLRHHHAREAERLTATLHALTREVRFDPPNQPETQI